MLTVDLEVEQSSGKVFATEKFLRSRKKSFVIGLCLQVFICNFNHDTTEYRELAQILIQFLTKLSMKSIKDNHIEKDNPLSFNQA